MCRVLVPLDGTSLAEQVLSDACELAGRNGVLILMHVIPTPIHDQGTDGFVGRTPAQGSEKYLHHTAKQLREEGYAVKTHTVTASSVADAIDKAASDLDADMIVSATHGRGPGGRLVHGGVAWKVLGESRVPILLKHAHDGNDDSTKMTCKPRILVPLDGSLYAEKALPVAARLARRWDAAVWLIQIIERPMFLFTPFSGTVGVDFTAEQARSEEYLKSVADRLDGDVRIHVAVGNATKLISEFVAENNISHVVLASHGRQFISRVILGSVADGLVHQLRCPVVVVPTNAPGRIEDHESIETARKQLSAV